MISPFLANIVGRKSRAVIFYPPVRISGACSGSLDFIKKELSIPENAWNEELMRVDVHNPLLHNARFPSGFERGANELFKWGGYTKGGMPEIVVDQFPIGGYSANTIGVKP